MRVIDYGKALPWTLAIISATLLVIVTGKHRKLTDDIITHRRADLHAIRGSYLPAFTGISTSGDTVVVGSSPTIHDRQLVIYLTSTCQYCRQSFASWRSIASALDTLPHKVYNVRVVALTSDSMGIARSFAEREKLPFPIIPFGERRLLKLARASSVPQTLVIDHEGRVIYSRSGSLTTKAAADSVLAAAESDIKKAPTVLRSPKV